MTGGTCQPQEYSSINHDNTCMHNVNLEGIQVSHIKSSCNKYAVSTTFSDLLLDIFQSTTFCHTLAVNLIAKLQNFDLSDSNFYWTDPIFTGFG